MTKPFAIITGDPLFDPAKPVTVNGYLYTPIGDSMTQASRASNLAHELESLIQLIDRSQRPGGGSMIPVSARRALEIYRHG